MRAFFGSQGMIQWRLRQLMAEINLSNNDLAEIAGIHRVTVSKLKNSDVIKQISGDVLNKLCNGLTVAYRRKDRDRVITPGDLLVFTPDQDYLQKENPKGESDG
ncbi:MAG: helix-turn-helix transcriptional regulator [Cyanobacteria bacterium P01_H01_bin.105]